jgi:hypothetical protein
MLDQALAVPLLLGAAFFAVFIGKFTVFPPKNALFFIVDG